MTGETRIESPKKNCVSTPHVFLSAGYLNQSGFQEGEPSSVC